MTSYSVVGTGPEAYERYLVPALFAPLADAMLAAARPVGGQRVLDVACGTGIVARRAATAAGEVTGVDVNPAMLAVAGRIAPGIRWTRGDAAALPFPDGSFDVVFCQQGLQFVPDPAAALAEMRRVLVPGGRVAVALWRNLVHSPGFQALTESLDRRAGSATGDLMRGPFRMGDAGDVRAMMAGFADLHIAVWRHAVRFPSVAAFVERQVAGSPLAGPVTALPATTRRAIVADVTDALAGHTDDDGLVFAIESHIVTAR